MKRASVAAAARPFKKHREVVDAWALCIRSDGVADFTTHLLHSESLLAAACATRNITVLDVSGWDISTAALIGAVMHAAHLKKLVATCWTPTESWKGKTFSEVKEVPPLPPLASPS